MQVVSNGILKSVEEEPGAAETWTWFNDKPIATCFVSMAISNYTCFYTQEARNSFIRGVIFAWPSGARSIRFTVRYTTGTELGPLNPEPFLRTVVLRGWRTKYRSRSPKDQGASKIPEVDQSELAELKELRPKLAHTERERDILKKPWPSARARRKIAAV